MLKDKVQKLQRLSHEGATEGERGAAKHALDRLRERYGDELDALLAQDELPVKDYFFRFWTESDKKTLKHVIFHMDMPVHLVGGAGGGTKKMYCCVCDEPTSLIVEELYNYHRKKLNRLFDLFANGYLYEAMPLPENRTDTNYVKFSDDERAAMNGGKSAGQKNQKQGRTRLLGG